MSDRYYGVYLIPPPALIGPLAQGHALFAKQFGTRTADKFSVHCTIKGFFKLAPGVAPADFLPALDALCARTPAFPVTIQPPWIGGDGKTPQQSVLLWLERTPALLQFHRAVWDIVRPAVAPDCLFTGGEYHGDNFLPHITLVQQDLPGDAGLTAQAQALADYVYRALPAPEFPAQDMQLLEFESADWAGAWWETLRFRPLRGWQLAQGGAG
jgi:hypothetical protein